MKTIFTVFTLGDWVVLGLLALLIVYLIIYFIYSWILGIYNRKFKKNCYYCKNWHLINVASCGDGSEYKCMKCPEVSTFNRYHRMVKSNELDFWVKCDHFESKYNDKPDGAEQQDTQTDT